MTKLLGMTCLIALIALPSGARDYSRDGGGEQEGHERPRSKQQQQQRGSNPVRPAPGVPARTRVIVPNRQRVPDAPRRGQGRGDDQSRQQQPRQQKQQPQNRQQQQRRQEADKRVPADRVPGRHPNQRGDNSKDKKQDQARPPRRVWEQPSHPPGKITDHRQAKAPDHDDQGHRIDAKPYQHAPDHATIINNTTITKNIAIYNQNETVVNHYYWHNDGGVRYCHYYDGGVHWYGWYAGPRYYWTRWYANSWWWYDPGYARWLWWDDGYWWWRDRTVVYVYNDGNYVDYNQSAAAVPAVSTATEAQHGDAYYSPDGSRLVQIYGDRNEAFLYSRYAGEEPEFMTFLGRDIQKVDFSSTTDPDKLQILLTFKDGHFEVLDNRGGKVN